MVDVLDRRSIGSDSEVAVESLSSLQNTFGRSRHDRTQAGINLIGIPRLGLAVLLPFKITDCNTAGIAEDGGEDFDAFFEKMAFCFGRGW